MGDVTKIADEIIRKRSNLSKFRNDFTKTKRKFEKLEKDMLGYKGDDLAWQKVEVWTPLVEEISGDLHKIIEKVTV